MDTILDPHPRLLRKLAQTAMLAQHPLTITDVGCSGGLHAFLSPLGDDIVAHGFDPSISECERLTKHEHRSRVRYHGAYVGLEPAHAFLATPPPPRDGTRLVSYESTSAAWALANGSLGDVPTNVAPTGVMADPACPVVLDEFWEREGLDHIDFLKIDTDGHEPLILRSCEKFFARNAISVVAIEVCYFGSASPRASTFANIDLFLRAFGFDLLNLSIWRYSLRDLPAPFTFRSVGETVFGPPLIGEAVYVAMRLSAEADVERDVARMLKQATLADAFGVPDCAAALLNKHRTALVGYVDVDEWLDALVPRLRGEQRTYADYLATFKNDIARFFPAGE